MGNAQLDSIELFDIIRILLPRQVLMLSPVYCEARVRGDSTISLIRLGTT